MLYACTPPNMPQTPNENPVGWQHPKQQDPHMNYEDVEILTEDGCKLHAWFIYQPDRYRRPTLLYFHGNAGNVGFRLPLFKELFFQSKVNILAVDYRGYGLSTGKPSEKGLNLDADAALDYIRARKDIDHENIVVFGRSLGGAVAVSLCNKRKSEVSGLIVENTYASMEDLAKDLFSVLKFLSPLLPFLLKNKWETKEKIQSVDCPILFISGLQDRVIPPRHMKMLCKNAPKNPKNIFKQMLGGHNDTPIKNPFLYYETINKFLSTLGNSK